MSKTPKFLTIRETAKLGIISEHHLRLLAAQKHLPGVYAGNRFKVNVDALVEQLERESGRELNEWCDHKADKPDPDMARDCAHYKSKTNADLIRGMTDEELAEWLVDHDEKCFHSGHLSIHGYITWLKQEVQE